MVKQATMTYKETLDFLYSSLPMYQRTGKAAYKANLDNTLALDKALGHPHRDFPSVHIAGTNGKGSVSHMLASIFQAAGYKTGLYTSPHMLDFRERIRVNGKMISENDVLDFVQRIKPQIKEICPSFFEMTVAMAFDHFSRERVDMAIIETGMGGRLDSTNILIPELSVLTSISMDHTEFLGDTLVKIAGEKAGIIKEGIPVVCGSNSREVNEVFEKKAAAMKAGIEFSEDRRTFLYQTYTVDMLNSMYHFRNLADRTTIAYGCDLTGSYQSENLNIVISSIGILQELGWKITESAITSGLMNVKKNTDLRGRWELLGSNPRIICDNAHNEAGIRQVINQLIQIPCRELHIVFGTVGEKAIDRILPLLPAQANYYFTQASIPRALPVSILKEEAALYNLTGRSYKSVGEAFTAARKNAHAEDTIFVGGSTFVVADLLEYLQK